MISRFFIRKTSVFPITSGYIMNFPTVFLWFSRFPMVFLWISHFPMLFPMVYQGENTDPTAFRKPQWPTSKASASPAQWHPPDLSSASNPAEIGPWNDSESQRFQRETKWAIWTYAKCIFTCKSLGIQSHCDMMIRGSSHTLIMGLWLSSEGDWILRDPKCGSLVAQLVRPSRFTSWWGTELDHWVIVY